MKVLVRFFALYRESAGTNRTTLELADGATVKDLVGKILTDYPAVASDGTAVVVAVNSDYVSHNFVLHEGDEAALIPPVSGGIR